MSFDIEDEDELTPLSREMKIMDIGFRWKTSAGPEIKIQEFATSHMFYSLRMLFNHLADQFTLGNEETVGDWTPHTALFDFMAQYGKAPKTLIKTAFYLQVHLESRRNLSFQLQQDFTEICVKMKRLWPKAHEKFFNGTDTLLDDDV
jgi:hypothetical protein